jgi:hypothetical protein
MTYTIILLFVLALGLFLGVVAHIRHSETHHRRLRGVVEPGCKPTVV